MITDANQDMTPAAVGYNVLGSPSIGQISSVNQFLVPFILRSPVKTKKSLPENGVLWQTFLFTNVNGII
jgi:hypothetical protein